jgi:hypothetical protein
MEPSISHKTRRATNSKTTMLHHQPPDASTAVEDREIFPRIYTPLCKNFCGCGPCLHRTRQQLRCGFRAVSGDFGGIKRRNLRAYGRLGSHPIRPYLHTTYIPEEPDTAPPPKCNPGLWPPSCVPPQRSASQHQLCNLKQARDQKTRVQIPWAYSQPPPDYDKDTYLPHKGMGSPYEYG